MFVKNLMYILDNTKIKLTFMHLIEIKKILIFSKEAILFAAKVNFSAYIRNNLKYTF